MAKQDFNVLVSIEQVGVTTKGFGRVLVIDTKNEIPLTYLRDRDDIKKIEIEEDTGVIAFLEDIYKQTLIPERVLVAGAIGNALDVFKKVEEQDSDYFYVTMVDNDAEDVTALLPAVVAKKKMLGTTVASVEAGKELIETAGDKAKELLVVGVHEDEKARLGQMVVMKAAGAVPGKATLKFQNIAGLGPSKFATDREDLHEAGMITYKKEQKRLMTSEGLTASGEYIDIIIGKYYIITRIEEDAAALAYTTANKGSKISYDDDGIAQLVGVVSGVGDEVADHDLITEYDIDFKRRAETSVKDRANRFYNGINARFELKGAIHEADFYINLAY